jgi:hypothetical protein
MPLNLATDPLVGTYETQQESSASNSLASFFQVLIPHLPTTVEDDSLSLNKHISSLRGKDSWKKKLLISTAIVLALAMFLVLFLPLPTCAIPICHSLSQSTKQPSPQYDGKKQDQNLSVELVTVESPSFVLPFTSISAVSLSKNTSTYDTIIINIKDLRYGGTDIFIDYVALKLLSIPSLPPSLKVWTPGVATTYIGYSYPVTYTGQKQDQLLYAKPPVPVILAPAGPNKDGESEKLSLKIMSTKTAYLWFQVEIAYSIIGAPQPPIILPHIFKVVFSDTSNWQEEKL